MTGVREVEEQLVKRLHRVLEERWGAGDALWREVINRRATRLQHQQPLPVETPAALRALSELRSEGIVTLPIASLTGGAELFERIAADEQRIVDANAADIAAERAAFEKDGRGYKGYQLKLQPGAATALDAGDAAVRFALHPEILGAVNEFLGLYSELRMLEYWYVLASERQTPAYSQLWHRDFEDIALVKVFLYLSDVDESSGPFSFIRGTHQGTLRWRDPEAIAARRTNRASDDEIAAIVPRERWFTGTGSQGTILMAATKGYHKGGFATKRDRRLLTANYFSPWCRVRHPMKRIAGIPPDAHPAVRFAVRGGAA
jgi:hypothetical protein